MKIEKIYRKLEDTEEVRMYDIKERDLYVPTPKEFDVPKIPFENTLNYITNDIDIFIPHNNGEDFIVQHLGSSALQRGQFNQEDVAGRLLSKITPGFHDVLIEPFREVLKTHETKKIRFLYHDHDKLSRFSNSSIVYDSNKIILISDHKDNNDNEFMFDDDKYDEKANLIEYFSQTGSYYKIQGKYTWTQGVYNIINRPREENDEYYNIIFDLVIPEDRPLVEKILEILDRGQNSYEAVIRIRTDDGTLKFIEINLYSKFDEEGNLISRYGLFKDVTSEKNRKLTRPVDFLLKGFKNSKKLALLIEPLNLKQHEFSEGFYNLIEVEPDNYTHNREIIENIKEESVKQDLIKFLDGKSDEIFASFSYKVHGNEDNVKNCELYIERFEFGTEIHSIGFLTDISEEYKKHLELVEANEHQKVLIKEVHHRVKNNLQVLNSFLNLEKRAYKNKPSIIIDHMQSRLSSLAILHEKTYNTTDFKNINLKEYIIDQDSQLRSLIGLRDGIEFVSEVDEDLNLTIEVITPLLLVIDELTMNAIKHAFPDKEAPNKKIFKTIRKIDDDTGELVLQDNGIGIENPAKITKNLGCEIIRNLTRQLNGHVELFKHENGTGYKLRFPLDMEHTIEG